MIIECARRLIAEQNIRVLDDRPSDGYSLLLTAGELIRELVSVLIKSQRMSQFINIQRMIGQIRADLDIFLYVQIPDQVIHLKDITEMLAPVLR